MQRTDVEGQLGRFWFVMVKIFVEMDGLIRSVVFCLIRSGWFFVEERKRKRRKNGWEECKGKRERRTSPSWWWSCRLWGLFCERKDMQTYINREVRRGFIAKWTPFFNLYTTIFAFLLCYIISYVLYFESLTCNR